MKKKVYIDMDNVIVNFQSGIDRLDETTKETFKGELDNVPGIFALMKPIDEAIKAVHQLAEKFDIYILSTAPWDNPTAWTDKINWIHKYFGKDEDSVVYKRLILSHKKNLNIGNYLIDDRTANGAGEFKGEHIHFGQGEFKNWKKVLEYLFVKEGFISN